MKKLEANDPETQSADIVADNVSQLQLLFPEVFSDGKIHFDVLRQLLGEAVDEDEEKYGLNWHGKRRARQIALVPSSGTLRPCQDKSIEWETAKNLLIEGDNLEVLKLLQKSYAGKVKMIYIDPPYNTGKDFIYPDNFRDNIGNYLELTGQVEGGVKITANTETSGRFHTDWLNMIYPRLRLARSLLREDGVIFISIDDVEVSNLRKVCDEIFGEENFIANVVWQKKYAVQNDARYFSDMHDHILVYAKSYKTTAAETGFEIGLLPRSEDQNDLYKNPDNDPRGVWQSTSLLRKDVQSTGLYEITTPSGRKCVPPPGTSWRVPRHRYDELLSDDRITFGASGEGVPRLKRFLSEVQDGMRATTWWTREECGDNAEAKKEVNALMGDLAGSFDTPKPLKLINRMLMLATKSEPDAIVLDFFAGSGTTAHAVMLQNLQDGGNRRYIVVQLPEPIGREDFPTIASLLRERLIKAAEKIKGENPAFKGDTGFRVFCLDSSNVNSWDPDRDNLTQTLIEHAEHIKSDRSETDIVYELLLKLGLDLSIPIESRAIEGKSIGAVGGGVLMLCLSEKIAAKEVESLAAGIVSWHKELAPAGDSTVVFRDSAFADDVAKTNMAAILAQNGLENVRSL